MQRLAGIVHPQDRAGDKLLFVAVKQAHAFFYPLPERPGLQIAQHEPDVILPLVHTLHQIELGQKMDQNIKQHAPELGVLRQIDIQQFAE